MTNHYRICTNCVMDTTDPDIQFDENGVCNHCRTYATVARATSVPFAEGGEHIVNAIVKEIKDKGQNKAYDCIIGVSGGVDSTYVAYKVKELGLRPLAVHLDNGWNSELAVNNIEKTLKVLKIDLYTHVIDWEEFKKIQLAFLHPPQRGNCQPIMPYWLFFITQRWNTGWNTSSWEEIILRRASCLSAGHTAPRIGGTRKISSRNSEASKSKRGHISALQTISTMFSSRE
jgi:hypothetical protein